MLNDHMCPVAILLDMADTEHIHHYRKRCYTASAGILPGFLLRQFMCIHTHTHTQVLLMYFIDIF